MERDIKQRIGDAALTAAKVPQEEQQDEPKEDAAMANADDAASLEKLNQIVEKILDKQSNPQYRKKWDALHPAIKEFPLEAVMGACGHFSETDKFKSKCEAFFENFFEYDGDFLTKFVSDLYADCLEGGFIVEKGTITSSRVVSITHGLHQPFLGRFDFDQLHIHITKVLEWHKTGHKQFRSPSFAMVQSSGMGKTKLMREYAHQHNECPSNDVQCRLILCMGEEMVDPPDFEQHYHGKLTLARHGDFTENDAENIRSQLHEMEKTCTKKVVIFFFDEAQMLLPGKTIGAYHAVLWWLRQDRTQIGREYVGVFAGTLLGLSKFQVVNNPAGFSRSPQQKYKNYSQNDANTESNLSLYQPFYSLTTISIARTGKWRDDSMDDDDELIDIRKHGYNGRPLFAAMLRNDRTGNAPVLTLSKQNLGAGFIENLTMYNILLRILLSNQIGWAEDDNSIASVLGTRVQLGMSNYEFVNQVTSKGYATLVRYDAQKSNPQSKSKHDFGMVGIVFPPDPVCAALAMGMMQPEWALRNGASEIYEIRGKGPKFWIRNMTRLLNELFFLPNRGESGEVFAALYMLLCGDVLRQARDAYMRLFEVDLEAWLGQMQQEAPTTQKAKKRPNLEIRRSPRLEALERMGSVDTTTYCLTLNFIQVCRNYFRSHAWFGQSMLEYMYDSATGCYVFPNCPSIDIVFSIKKVNTKDGAVTYHPCLVSVKCWDSIERSDMKSALTSMRTYVQNHRQQDDEVTTALCLLIVIGASRGPRNLPQQQGSFPNQDTYISIVVPSRDQFGINNTLTNMAGTSHTSELLASHPFAAAENVDFALRVSAKKTYQNLGHSLLEDKKKLWKGKSQAN